MRVGVAAGFAIVVALAGCGTSATTVTVRTPVPAARKLAAVRKTTPKRTPVERVCTKHVTVNGILLTPLAVTRDNLNAIVDKGWITKAEVCAGVKPGTAKYCG